MFHVHSKGNVFVSLCGSACTENPLKQGHVLPKAVIAEKCTNPSECKDLRPRWPSWCAGGSSSSTARKRLQALLHAGRALRHGYWVWKRRAFFWCLHLEATSPIACSQEKNKQQQKRKILFLTCLPWLLWSHSVLVCLLLSFLSFPFITTGTNSFTDTVVCLLCAWRQKTKQNKRKPTKGMKLSKCLRVWCGTGTGEDDDTDLYAWDWCAASFSSFHRWREDSLCKAVLGLPGGSPINRQIYVT